MARVSRPLVTFALAAAVVGAAALPAGTASAAAPPAPKVASPKGSPDVAAKLGQKDVERLDKAIHDRKATVTIMVATSKRNATKVAAQVKALGGQVRKTSDDVGYLSAKVPTGAVKAVAALSDVQAVDLEEILTIPDPRPQAQAGAGATALAAVAGPSASTPDSNPFMPTRDIKATNFKVTHPTWDGRGTTIGILDSGIDVDHPALQTTTTGERKIVDWFNGLSTTEDDPEWVRVSTPVSGPTFTVGGTTYTSPAGSYQFGTIAESGFAATDLAGDLNRDGDTTDVWGVLYDPATHDVRVDTDANLDFTDNVAMQPYGSSFQIGHFGTDNPATDISESVPFTVEWRDDAPAITGGTADFVGIDIAAAEHGTHVAGITAARSLFGGAMNGVAPGAKLVAARACIANSCSNVALTDGLVELVVNRHVDVVNISIGGLPALNDGNNARVVLYNRLIHDNNVQIVLSAGNSGPGINTIGDPGLADLSIAAAASITKETWLSNYNSVVSANNQLFNFSSRGPREDGGLKPDVAAPGSAISTIPTWEAGGPVAETGYPLPAGYAMLNGTSMASPQTAGAVALLISAAKANGLSVTTAQIRQAVKSSADLIPGVPVVGQGSGLVNVPAAWSILAAQPAVQDYTVKAPVCTAISGFLATPNSGTGIYNDCLRDAGGQRPGQTVRYPVTITRTSGAAGLQKHTLKWVGNDGTFSGPASVKLDLGVPVTITVKAKAAGMGDFSALLAIDNPATAGVDKYMSAVVTTSAQLIAPKFFTRTKAASVQRNRFQSIYVEVLPGTKALDVQLSGLAAGSQTRFIAFTSWGQNVEDTSSLNCYTNFSTTPCNQTERSYANPLPGVWEFEVESRRTSPLLDNPYTLTVQNLSVDVTPNPDTIASATIGVPIDRTYTMTSTGAATTAVLNDAALDSARLLTPTISQGGAQQQYVITVPAGSTQLRVKIGNASDHGADLDLFLFRCAPSCTLVAQSAGSSAEEAVTVSNPAAGTWVALVDPFDIPSGSTTYDYVDAIANPAYGTVDVDNTPAALAAGGSATRAATVTATAAPPTGRVLLGNLRVTGPGGVLIGSASVIVQSVS